MTAGESSAEPVLYELADDVARITLNRPNRLNAVNAALVSGLCSALDRAMADDARGVVLSGTGTSFSAGHDLKEDLRETDRAATARLQEIQDVTRKIRRAQFPVVAAVKGYALGAGCEFALACDLIVAGTGSVFGFPEVEVGLGVTGGISYFLPLVIGPARAKELVLLGRRFGADEARHLGLVNTVVDDDQVLDHALALAGELAQRPRTALALAKRILDQAPLAGLDAAYELEIADSLILRETGDAAEAQAAFRSGTHGRPAGA